MLGSKDISSIFREIFDRNYSLGIETKMVQLHRSCCSIVLLLVIARSKIVDAIQCKDENNEPVDWYVLYKIPKISESSDAIIRKGRAYVYLTNKSMNAGWQLSRKDITTRNSIPAHTLAPLYNDTEAENLLWVLYNDDPPNKSVTAKYGHTKGAVVANKDEGFWLIHSVPNFPPVPNTGEAVYRRGGANESNAERNIAEGEYSYPRSGEQYGQSFLCVSLGKDAFDTVGTQLIYNQITVYKKNLPQPLSTLYPILTNASNEARMKSPPYMHKASITSLGSQEFVSFAKSDKWQKELYDDFVAPQLQSDIYTETWLNGRGRLASDCNGTRRVLNVESVVLHAANIDFRSSQDHSKWAVSIDNKKNKSWVCIGDINRADTQYHRGGGTVCSNMPKVWRTYRYSVNDVEACPKRAQG